MIIKNKNNTEVINEKRGIKSILNNYTILNGDIFYSDNNEKICSILKIDVFTKNIIIKNKAVSEIIVINYNFINRIKTEYFFREYGTKKHFKCTLKDIKKYKDIPKYFTK